MATQIPPPPQKKKKQFATWKHHIWHVFIIREVPIIVTSKATLGHESYQSQWHEFFK